MASRLVGRPRHSRRQRPFWAREPTLRRFSKAPRELIEPFCAGPRKKPRAEVRGSFGGRSLCATDHCTKRLSLAQVRAPGERLHRPGGTPLSILDCHSRSWRSAVDTVRCGQSRRVVCAGASGVIVVRPRPGRRQGTALHAQMMRPPTEAAYFDSFRGRGFLSPGR